MRVVFFILAGFCFQIKSNTILLTSVAKFFGVSITLEMNTSLEKANVLTIFILPYMDRSLRDQTLKVFFRELNLSKRIFLIGQLNVVSEIHPERIDRIIANLEVANCVFPMAHRAKPKHF